MTGAFERCDVEGVRTLFVSGEVDLATADEFCEQLWQAMVEAHSPTTVDLSRVEFMDCSGVNALINAHREAPSVGTELVLVAPSSSCRRILDLLELTHHFRIIDA